MGKDLSEMTLEELWMLFPITLVEHKDNWADDYKQMEKLLEKLLSAFSVYRISHIGSTAIDGIMAKDIIDVLVEFPKDKDIKEAAEVLANNGFVIMSSEDRRVSLNRGYTNDGFADKVYHIHLRYAGDNDELYFRDYLNEYHWIAEQYEKLKLAFAEKYRNNRDAYTDAKSLFINMCTTEAKQVYGDKY